MKQKVLITGASGRIGHILCSAWKDSEQYEIFGIDKTGIEDVAQCNLSRFEELETVFKNLSPIDTIIHLAADSRIDAPWESVLENNILATKNVYQSARLFDVPKVIFASTNHVTGGYEADPEVLDGKKLVTVHDPLRPDSDYAVSKVFGEALARSYQEVFDISSVCLRIGSVLTDDDPTTMPRTLRTWLSYRDTLQLFQCALQAQINFGIYYGVSANTRRFWDIENARREIGFEPFDNAETYAG